MHILLNVVKHQVYRTVMGGDLHGHSDHINYGFRNLIRQVPIAVLQLVLEHYTHAQMM